MNKLVSIIVPVYNVEKELERCIKSIIKQTYHELDILLIDDGSTDHCPEICDDYGRMDNRIRVFHKANGGLSSARNYGLDRIKGEYISFIDSDDWVEENFIETLVNNIERERADLSIVGTKLVWENKKEKKVCEDGTYCVFNRDEAIRELFIQKKFQCMVWQKLYKKDFFKSLRFIENVIYEDVEISLPIFTLCDKVVFDGKCLYSYFQRQNSIVNKEFNSIKMNFIRFADEYVQYARTQNKFIMEAEAFYIRACWILLMNAIPCEKKSPVSHDCVKQLLNEVKLHKNFLLNNPYIEKRRKYILFALIHHMPRGVLRIALLIKNKW